MAHLLVLGGRSTHPGLEPLLGAHLLTFVRDAAALPPDLGLAFDLVLALSARADLEGAAEVGRRLSVPWLAWSPGAEPAAASAALRAGALAALPGDAPADLLPQTVERLLANLRPAPAVTRIRQSHRAGDRLSLDAESTLEVLTGIVSLTVLHEDGAEVLLGLYGSGHVLPGHPEDACCIQLYAHTDCTVQIRPWREAARRPDLGERLRDRLRFMEAWAAMQARPQIEQRLHGILSLLGEQFGRRTPRGLLIEVRITHSQLASAVGATRTTVTRLLGRLRRRGLLLSVTSSQGERYCLTSADGGLHHRASG